MSSHGNINIPLEIVIDILVRLPVKSIFRFKCVCKSWYVLIQSHEFFKLHLNRSLNTNSYNCSLVLSVTSNVIIYGSPVPVSLLYRAYLDPNRTSLDLKEVTLPLAFRLSLENISTLLYRQLNFNSRYVKYAYGNIEVVSSCNGLVLIVSGNHHYAVGNPAIEHEHAFKILPCISYVSRVNYGSTEGIEYHYRGIWRPRFFTHKVFGFGYDSVNCGHTVVYLTPYRALIYSVARDDRSWRTIDLPYNIIKYGGTDQEKNVLMKVHSHGVSTNNHLHWNITEYDPEIYEYSRESILSFVICNEEWSKVPMPDELDKGYSLFGFRLHPYIIEVGVLDGCLCMLISRGISCPSLELWIMKEYGVEESWTMLSNRLPVGSGIPLFYHKDRFEFLLPGSQHGLGWFNPSNNKIRKVEFHGCGFTGENYYSTRVKLCLESFVNPSSPIY